MKNDFIINLPSSSTIFDNYTELCNYLNIPVLGGKSKQLQLKKLKRYFNWIREGKKYIITEIYNTPQYSSSTRGKNKPLTRYQYLFNTILLNQLIYGGTHDEGNESCISFTKTELRQGLFKLVNKNYYNIRKDIKRASRETGLTEEMLKFADRKVTDKMNSMSFRGFKQLEEEGRLNVSEGLYVYYIDLQEYFNTGKKIIRSRCVNDTERILIMSAGWIGEKEFENELEELEFEEKLDPDTYRGRKSKSILRSKLEILNGVEYIEGVINKLINENEDENEEVDPAVAPINVEELILTRWKEVMEARGKELIPLNKEQLEELKHSEGLNAYALEKGEFWINIVRKTRFFVYTPHILKLELIDRIGKLQSMPGAQLELNQYMLDWISEKAQNVWGGFSQQFLNESRTGSRDIVKDMGIFTGTYVDITAVEKNYKWQEYTDCGGRPWKVRYSSEKMKFDKINLRLPQGTKVDDVEPKVILWNAPQKGMLCTNDGKLLGTVNRVWTKREWMPIEGYLGGIWNEGEGKEIGCIILDLGEEGIVILKEEWGKSEESEGNKGNEGNEMENEMGAK